MNPEPQDAAAIQRRLARHHMLTAQVGLALVRNTSIRPMLQECLATTSTALDAAVGRIWLLDAQDNVLILEASTDAGAVDAHARVAVGASVIGAIAADRRPHVSGPADVAAGSTHEAGDVVVEGMAFAGYPLLLGSTLVGVIALSAPSPFPEDTLATLQQVADSVALGIKRLRTEADLRDLAGSLDRRVADRTRELEESNRQLEAFSYSVAHDLRAPIRHIHGFAERLQKHAADSLDATSTHYLHTIAAAARSAGTLIDELLAFSRVARTALEVREIDLNVLVASVQSHLAPEARGRVIQWEIGLLPRVMADPDMLRLVLKNLLSNAIKFTRPQPLPVIQVEAVVDATTVTVSVTDNGVGFDMQHAQQLFGVFHRLHRVEEFEGTGIGLATVRRIIHRHGGRTSAVGAVGAGATMTFTLPVRPPSG